MGRHDGRAPEPVAPSAPHECLRGGEAVKRRILRICRLVKLACLKVGTDWIEDNCDI
jgi:hypothetical protein